MKVTTVALLFATVLSTFALRPTSASALEVDISFGNQENRVYREDRDRYFLRQQEYQELRERQERIRQHRIAELRAERERLRYQEYRQDNYYRDNDRWRERRY